MEFNNYPDFQEPDYPPYCPYSQYNMMRMPAPRPPMGPPPAATPSKAEAEAKMGPSAHAVEPRTLRPCLYRFVYIWPRRERGFWAWPIFVGRRSVSGFRWNGRRWVYFGMNLRQIDSFICY
jgi:hypothetical protein